MDQQMSPVWSCNEWDTLEEVIVGNPLNARYPTPDKSTRLAEFHDRDLAAIPTGKFPEKIVEETEEDLGRFIETLVAQGVRVRRPKIWCHQASFSTIHWQAQGYYNYCPRDVMLVIGDQIIETPNVIRSRMFETYSYQDLLVEYLKSGARWYSAPKPMLLDSLYEFSDANKPTPLNDEPVFDAANVLRLGKDLLYLVSSTGNELGGRWLQTMLGDEFRVHFIKDVYYGSHIDTTLVALRPGLMLCNPARIEMDSLPDVLRQWEIIQSPPMVVKNVDADYLERCIGSDWIDMNLFSINPNLVVVDEDQVPLIRLLEKHRIDVIPLKLRHSRLLGGGFHCTTLDVRRSGTMQRYFH
jgi:N-dimethylarginine dimethylaminohydrolase